MKYQRNILHFLLLLINCASVSDIKLSKSDAKEISENNKIIEIEFSNFIDLKKEIHIELDSIEYISKDYYRFGQKYIFSEEILQDHVKIKIPNGTYVGSIKVTASKTIPFYKSLFGTQTIFFGINNSRLKVNYPEINCSNLKPLSNNLSPSNQNSIFCNDLIMNTKNYKINFLIEDNIELNSFRTLALGYAGISLGLSRTLQNYPYAPLVLLSSYFGFFHYDLSIKSEIGE